MRNSLKLLIIFTVLSIFQIAFAQNAPKLSFMAESKVNAPTTQIALRTDDENIVQVRVISERSGKLQTRSLQFSEAIFFTVDLEEGENKFTLLGYDKNGVPDPSAIKSVVITKISSSIVEEVTGNSGQPEPINETNSNTNSLRGNTFNNNNTTGGKVRLNGVREIKNKNKYKLEIDSSGVGLLAGFYLIEIKNDKGEIVSSLTRKIKFDDKIGRQEISQTEDIDLKEGNNIISVYPNSLGNALTKSVGSIQVNCVKPCKEKEENFKSQRVILKSIIGIEQSGASSAKSEQRPFLNFYFNAPIKIIKKRKSNSKNKNAEGEEDLKDKTLFGGFSVWGDVRLTTTPVQSIGSLAEFTPGGFATSFVQGDNASKINDLVRSFDFLIGVEQQIISPQNDVSPGPFPGRISLSLIAAGGAITPLSSDKTTLYFKIPTVNSGMNLDPRFTNLFPDIDFTGKTNVAFVTPDRDRFYRQYYGGIRLKTFFEDKNLENFPAVFDVMIGQNEAITNKLQGAILRVDGSTPLPINGAKFLTIFGSVNMRLSRNVNESIPQFFLDPATGASLSGSDTTIISIDRSPFQTRNRDIFRIGVGVDLFKLFKKEEAPKQ